MDDRDVDDRDDPEDGGARRPALKYEKPIVAMLLYAVLAPGSSA